MAPGPSARFNHAAVTLAGSVYLWGGFNGSLQNDGFIYNPTSGAAGSWSPMSSTAAPPGRFEFTMTPTDKELFIFGGYTIGGAPVNSGAHYVP